MRAYSVGTDIQVYGNNIFLGTKYDLINNVINMNARWANKGYVYFNWMVSRFTDNPHVFYGVLTMFFTLFVFVLFTKMNNVVNVSFSMLMFLFILWPVHLNILRQGLSIALTGFVFYFFINKKYIWGIIFALGAFYIHDSSIVVSFIYFLITFFSENYIKLSKYKLKVFSVLVVVVGIIGIPIILKYFPNIMTSFADKYYYIASSLHLSSFSIIRFLTFMFPILVFFPIIWENHGSFYNSTFLISLINAIFSGFSGMNYVLFGRMSYYFYIPLIIFIGQSIKLVSNSGRKLILYILFGIYSLSIFVGLYALGNYGNLFPYYFG
jgi:hypothetical protein